MMYCRILAVATFLACIACGQDTPARTSVVRPEQRACNNGGSMMLSDSGIGAVRLGVDAAVVNAECWVWRDTVRTDAEGLPQRVLRVRLGPSALDAEVVDARVWRISISDSLLRTSDGLGVGSLLSELLAMPEATGRRGEGATYVRVPTYCGLSFQLDSVSARELRGGATLNPAALQRVAEVARVVRVLVTGCAGSGVP